MIKLQPHHNFFTTPTHNGVGSMCVGPTPLWVELWGSCVKGLWANHVSKLEETDNNSHVKPVMYGKAENRFGQWVSKCCLCGPKWTANEPVVAIPFSWKWKSCGPVALDFGIHLLLFHYSDTALFRYLVSGVNSCQSKVTIFSFFNFFFNVNLPSKFA
jgi:hypothetical protein